MMSSHCVISAFPAGLPISNSLRLSARACPICFHFLSFEISLLHLIREVRLPAHVPILRTF